MSLTQRKSIAPLLRRRVSKEDLRRTEKKDYSGVLKIGLKLVVQGWWVVGSWAVRLNIDANASAWPCRSSIFHCLSEFLTGKSQPADSQATIPSFLNVHTDGSNHVMIEIP